MTELATIYKMLRYKLRTITCFAVTDTARDLEGELGKPLMSGSAQKFFDCRVRIDGLI